MGQAVPNKRLYLFPMGIHSRAVDGGTGVSCDQLQAEYGEIHPKEKGTERIMKDLRGLLEKSQKLNTDIKKLLKESTYLEYDDLCMLDIDHKDAEQLLLQEQLCKVMQELEDVSDHLDYLTLPIKEVSRLHKNSDGRYETKSGHCFTSGCRVEALISDEKPCGNRFIVPVNMLHADFCFPVIRQDKTQKVQQKIREFLEKEQIEEMLEYI